MKGSLNIGFLLLAIYLILIGIMAVSRAECSPALPSYL